MVYNFDSTAAQGTVNYSATQLTGMYNYYNTLNCTPNGVSTSYATALKNMQNIYNNCLAPNPNNSLTALLFNNWTSFYSSYTGQQNTPTILVNATNNSISSTVFATTTSTAVYTATDLQNDMLTFINGNTGNILSNSYSPSQWSSPSSTGSSSDGVVNSFSQDLLNLNNLPDRLQSTIDVTFTYPSLYSNGMPEPISQSSYCNNNDIANPNANGNAQTPGTNSNIMPNYFTWIIMGQNTYYTPSLTSCAYNAQQNAAVQLSGSNGFQFTNYPLIIGFLLEAMKNGDESYGSFDSLKEAIAFGLSMQFICTMLIAPGMQQDILNNLVNETNSYSQSNDAANTNQNNYHTSWANIYTICSNFTLHVVYQIYSVVYSLSPSCAYNPQPVVQQTIGQMLGIQYETAYESCNTAITDAVNSGVVPGTISAPGMVPAQDLLTYWNELSNQWMEVSGNCSGDSLGTDPQYTTDYTTIQQNITNLNEMCINAANAYEQYSQSQLAQAGAVQPLSRMPDPGVTNLVNSNTQAVVNAYQMYLDGLIVELEDMLAQLKATGIQGGSSTILNLTGNSIYNVPTGTPNTPAITMNGFPLSQQISMYLPRGPAGISGTNGATGSAGGQGENGPQGTRGSKGPTETPIQFTPAYGFIPYSPFTSNTFPDSTTSSS